MANFKGRPLSPNILDLRDPLLPLLQNPFGFGTIPKIVDTWSNRSAVAQGKKQSWAIATDQANRRKTMEKETSPDYLKEKRALRNRVLDTFFGDPMRVGKEQEEFQKRMSDIITNFGKNINGG